MSNRFISTISILGLVFLLGTSCDNLLNNKNVKILEEDELIPVLIDMHIADGMLAQIVDKDSMLKQSNLIYRELFLKHHTDYKTFKNSMKFYTNEPEKLTEIYKIVLDSVNNRLVLKKPNK